jgi:hypothetical protein
MRHEDDSRHIPRRPLFQAAPLSSKTIAQVNESTKQEARYIIIQALSWRLTK